MKAVILILLLASCAVKTSAQKEMDKECDAEPKQAPKMQMRVIGMPYKKDILHDFVNIEASAQKIVSTQSEPVVTERRFLNNKQVLNLSEEIKPVNLMNMSIPEYLRTIGNKGALIQ